MTKIHHNILQNDSYKSSNLINSDRIFWEINFPDDIACGSQGGIEYLTDIITTRNGREQRNINWFYPRMRYNITPGIKTIEEFNYVNTLFRNCYGRAIGFRFKDWSDYQCNKQYIGIGDGITSKYQLIKSYIIKQSNGDVITKTRNIYKPVKKKVKLYIDNELVYSNNNTIITNNHIDKYIQNYSDQDQSLNNDFNSEDSGDLFYHFNKNVMLEKHEKSKNNQNSNNDDGRNDQDNRYIGNHIDDNRHHNYQDNKDIDNHVNKENDIKDNQTEVSNMVQVNYTNGLISFSRPPRIKSIITADFEFDVPVRFDIDYLPASIEGLGMHMYVEIPLLEIKH